MAPLPEVPVVPVPLGVAPVPVPVGVPGAPDAPDEAPDGVADEFETVALARARKLSKVLEPVFGVLIPPTIPWPQ